MQYGERMLLRCFTTLDLASSLLFLNSAITSICKRIITTATKGALYRFKNENTRDLIVLVELVLR